MSEPQTKGAKTGNDAPYELIYWPGLPGRGEFTRLLFEEAGVPFTDHTKSADKVIRWVQELIGPDHIGDETNPPIFAPPALKHGDLLVHQCPNILLYLAPRLGLAPTEGTEIYHLNQIVLTLLDGFVAEMHETHHPIATSMYYQDQKVEAKKRSRAYIDERIPKFLTYVQRVLDAKTSGSGPWLYGDSLTYADLVLFQVRSTLKRGLLDSFSDLCSVSMAPSTPFPNQWTS